jgi:hypothetical protein
MYFAARLIKNRRILVRLAPAGIGSLLVVLLLLLSGCRQLSEQNRDRLEEMRARGETLAGTAISSAPSYAATARSAAATAIAVAPTAIVNAQSAAATAAANAQAVATRAALEGTNLLEAGQSLREILGQVQPDGNGNVQFTISEAQLTNALRRDEIETGDARLENLNATLADGQIVVTGEVVRPIRAPFAIVLVPYVTPDGTLQIAATSATVGQIELPDTITRLAVNRVNRTLLTTLSYIPGSYRFTNVQVTDGFLIVTATR